MFAQIVLDLAKEIVEKESIAQAVYYDYRPKTFWVCVTPTEKAAKHTTALANPNQKEQRGLTV